MDVSIVAILAVIGISAAVSRFIGRSLITEGLRLRLSALSPLLGKLLSCPHCLGFWIALLCATLLAGTWFQFVTFVLLGWRGGYYLNRLLDYLTKPAIPRPALERNCRVCGTPWKKDFLERHNFFFCSYRCWFDYLKETRQEASRASRKLFDDSGVFIRQELYPMSFEEISPAQARKRLDSGEGYIYLDVRTELEFENGHPTGAVNIPLLHRRQGGMAPNPDFLRVADTSFSRDTKLIVGCQMGARSSRAAEALVSVGYANVSNVRGGFGGIRNQLGQVVDKGWFQLGLPVESGAAEGQSYESLLTAS